MRPRFRPTSGQLHAFLYSNGAMTDLGTLGGTRSLALGINPSGEVVGNAQTASGQSVGFLYANGTMTDLNSLIYPSLGYTIQNALGINDRGQIAAIGLNAQGQQEALVLTPDGVTPPPPPLNSLTPLPEPSTLLPASIVGLMGLGYAWRRRKAKLAA